MVLNGHRLILASASPRRRNLLEAVGLDVHIHPVSIDESRFPGETPAELVARLARQKAQAAYSQVSGPYPILAADTIVVDGDQVLGKPDDSSQARMMLQQLRNREHLVLTAVALVDPDDGAMHHSICTTRVPMRNYNQAEMDDYIRSGSPLDKAGAYGIQDRAFNPVDLQQLDGCFANVMGLPLCHVAEGLCRLGWPIKAEQAAAWCRQATGFDCPEIPEGMRENSCLEN
ncbi:MAG: Maf family protein [Anaerolineales bacterium]|jgi:MAF protein